MAQKDKKSQFPDFQNPKMSLFEISKIQRTTEILKISLFEISEIQRTTGNPEMSLFELEQIQRTKVQKSRATKQTDTDLSEGPDHD